MLKRFVPVIIALLVVPAVVIPTFLKAEIMSSEDSIVIAVDEVITDDLFLAAETVTNNGRVEGTVFTAGGTVVVDGEVTGDVYAAGGMVTIKGTVEDDVVVTGGTVTLQSANVAGSLIAMGGVITIDSQTSVGGSIVTAGGLVSIAGDVGRNVVGGAGTMAIDANVGKSIDVGVGQLTIGGATKVGGDVTYTSDTDASISSGSTIAGNVSRLEPSDRISGYKGMNGIDEQVLRNARVGFIIWSYLSVLVVGFVLLYIAKPFVEGSVDLLSERSLTALFWGFIAFFISGPILLLLLMSVIGIHLSTLLTFGLGLGLYLGQIVVGLALGRFVSKSLNMTNQSAYVLLALGLLVLYVLTLIPYISFATFVVTAFVGFGGILLYLRDVISASRLR